MTRYAAFLRGINLGNRRFKMDELRAPIEGLDVENVQTYLASGNVVLDHRGSDPVGLEEEIEACLESELGLTTEAFVRTLERLGELAAAEALAVAADAGFRPHVIFLKEEAGSRAEEALGALETADDRFHILDREVVWLRRGRLSDSVIKTRDLEKALQGRPNTMRNLNTVRRLSERFGPSTE